VSSHSFFFGITPYSLSAFNNNQRHTFDDAKKKGGHHNPGSGGSVWKEGVENRVVVVVDKSALLLERKSFRVSRRRNKSPLFKGKKLETLNN
jgi:hypothetical protein